MLHTYYPEILFDENSVTATLCLIHKLNIKYNIKKKTL